MSLNISLLKNVVRREDGSIVAQCPACAAQCEDQTGRNHLIVFPNGRYGCAIYPLDHEGFGSEERKKHLRKIHQLVGLPFDDDVGGVGGHFQNARPRYVKRKPVATFR